MLVLGFIIATAAIPFGQPIKGADDNVGRHVFLLERALALAGYSPGPVDGVFDKRTMRALEIFQRDKRIPITGRPDQVTLRALGLYVKEQPLAP